MYAATDQPRFVADTIVNFIRRVKGRRALAEINLSNSGIWKRDERLMIQELRELYGIKAKAAPNA